MKKILSIICLSVFFFSGIVNAQQQSVLFYHNLVQKNAAAIGLSENDLENVRVSDGYLDKTSGAYMVYLQQTYKGVDVYNAISTVTFKNEKVAITNFNQFDNTQFEAKKPTATPSLSAVTALQKAATELGLTPKSFILTLNHSLDARHFEFDNLGIAQNNITVNLLWVPDAENKNYYLSWQVALHAFEKNAMWLINIDAITGKTISKFNLTTYETFNVNQARPRSLYVYQVPEPSSVASNGSPSTISSAKYNVIPYPSESPLVAGAALVTDPWTMSTNANAYTGKWNSDSLTDYTITRGNNVYVQDDHDSKDGTFGSSPVSTSSIPNLTFNYVPNFDASPSSDTPTMNFGLTNLFYWNNLMHDMSYQYGFDEVAGNFQSTNFGRGGKSKDYLVSDAQDLSGFENANFATPADGSSPRMQMFLWGGSIYKFVKVNSSPNNFAGYKLATEDSVSKSNRIGNVGPVTANMVIFQDPNFPDSSTGCKPAANSSALVGKIVYVDRGSCAFTVKFHNVQNAGGIGIMVGNVAPDDPRYIPAAGQPDGRGNRLVRMSSTPLDNSITIPGFFVMYDTAQKFKTDIKAGTVNTSFLVPPQIDGELDNTIPTHEYTHGISTRLVGGPQNVGCLNSLVDAEQMGEGWSDYYAVMMTENWATVSPVFGGAIPRPIGNYAAGLKTTDGGIRLYRYSTDFETDPWTYDLLRTDTTVKEYNFITHPESIYWTGEFWCTALWEVTWELIKTYGISPNIFDASGTGGNIIALKLVTEGMKLTRCSPGCVDARDGILKADTLLYGGKYSPELWRAFARRGLGVNADQGSVLKIKDAQGDYSVPGNLPVIWGSFTAQKQGNTAFLKWTTVQEANTDEFVIERSSDGRAYTSVGTVNAKGNSSTVSSYTFIDQHPINGNNIYRIKQVDRDGKFDFSDLRNLNFADVKPYITVSPNPTKDVVTINIPGNAETLTVQLIGNNGQQLSTYTMSGETLAINVSSLANGVYNITITAKDYTSKYKLVVQ